MMKRLLLTGCLLYAIAPAQADFESGMAAFENEEFEEAARLWRPVALEGHAEAQLNMGMLHETGQGVDRNLPEAVEWYRKAADRGVGTAQFDLGGMYFLAKGVEEDLVEAYKWLSLAAMNEIDEADTAFYLCIDRMSAEEIALAQSRTEEWNLVQD